MSVISRREREKLARRKSILQAARELFYLHGYQASTIDMIAERAELSKGTIYTYFESKDELYVSAVIEAFLELEKRLIVTASQDLAVEEKIKALFMAFVDHCLEYKEQLWLGSFFYTDTARKTIPRHLLDETNEHTWKCLDIIIQTVQEAKDKGVIREDVNPTEVSIIGWRAAVGLLEMAIAEEENEEDEKMYGNLFEQAITLILRAITR